MCRHIRKIWVQTDVNACVTRESAKKNAVKGKSSHTRNKSCTRRSVALEESSTGTHYGTLLS